MELKLSESNGIMQSIQVMNVSKSYGSHTVLSNLSMNIPYGECTVIMGPSGCGKTTLLRILMGLEQADDGIIEGMPERYSTVFQEDRLCMDFSAMRNIAMVLPRGKNTVRHNKDLHYNKDAESKYTKIINETEIRAHMERIGLPENSVQPVREYSGGMRRRTAIVRAVLSSGDLLILDEPFQGLDADTRKQVITYLQAEQRGRTLILVTHEKEDAGILGARVYHMG